MGFDINQIRFENQSIGTTQNGVGKSGEKDAKSPEPQANAKESDRKFDADAMFSAMNIVGMQNFAQINRAQVQNVDPTKYLDENRISDIEAAMAEFENGVDLIAQTIEAEFPNSFSDEQKYALAATVYAAE